MAEISAEMPVPAASDEVDFTLDIPGAEVVVEDLDFELGEVNGGASLEQDDGDGPTSALHDIEIAADTDEIDYEEDEGHAYTDPESTTGVNPRVEDSNTSMHDNAGDDFDYEEVEVVDTVITTHHNTEDTDRAEHDQDVGGNEINFSFDEGGEARLGDIDYDEADEHDHETYDQDNGSQVNDDKDEYSKTDEDDEDIKGDENEIDDGDGDQQQHGIIDQDESDVFDQEFDADDDADEEAPSEIGLGELRNMYPASTFDVMVTWGGQVCPLFKMPGVEDPDSFYLDDYEAMDYPLSKFLQTIRTSISSWVQASDEIYIRVEELGLEFGETTTEALLSQVTFHNLLALHSTLANNDDADAAEGVHITLGTRSNCLLRLKDLVSGAGSGKGLSSFHSASHPRDESSDESFEAEAESDDSLPDDVIDDMHDEDDEDNVDEDEDEDGGIDVRMSGSLDDPKAADQSIVDVAVNGSDGAELKTPFTENEEDADYGAAEEAHYVDYTDGGDDASNGVLLEIENLSEVATPDANIAKDAEFTADEESHLKGLDDDRKSVEQPNALEQLESTNGDEGYVEQHEDGATAQPLRESDTAGQDDEFHGEDGDDYLDLNGDFHELDAPAEALQAKTKADTEESFESSITATIDHDEIDYEEHHSVAINGNAPPGSSIDEIDWDDELKNAAPTSPSTFGKRTRDIDESDDTLLEEIPGMNLAILSHQLPSISAANLTPSDPKRARNNQPPS
ncbi:hypothetical protein SEPCBS119000_005179 [Sporothrix epigloea]|uniref:Uncharacterized protein n=1 Tax=Sporothrix epigloea TaxID=1892477 RepID=A0ABP0DW70_9PEZI